MSIKRVRLNGHDDTPEPREPRQGSSETLPVPPGFKRRPGRPVGSVIGARFSNKSITNSQVTKYARQFSFMAIDKLWQIGINEKNDAAPRVAALKAILDRGLGTAGLIAPLEGEDGNALPPITFALRIINPKGYDEAKLIEYGSTKHPTLDMLKDITPTPTHSDDDQTNSHS